MEAKLITCIPLIDVGITLALGLGELSRKWRHGSKMRTTKQHGEQLRRLETAIVDVRNRKAGC